MLHLNCDFTSAPCCQDFFTVFYILTDSLCRSNAPFMKIRDIIQSCAINPMFQESVASTANYLMVNNSAKTAICPFGLSQVRCHM